MIQYGVDFNDSWVPTVPTSNFHPRNPSAPAEVLHNQRDIATSPYVVACFDPDLWLATRVMFTLTFKLDETSDTSKTPGTASLDCETGRYLRNGLKVWRKVNFWIPNFKKPHNISYGRTQKQFVEWRITRQWRRHQSPKHSPEDRSVRRKKCEKRFSFCYFSRVPRQVTGTDVDCRRSKTGLAA